LEIKILSLAMDSDSEDAVEVEDEQEVPPADPANPKPVNI
jgi:hypothetical protein